MKSQPKMSAAQEKKDKAIDKKQGIKENSKPDLSKDAMIQQLKSTRNMK